MKYFIKIFLSAYLSILAILIAMPTYAAEAGSEFWTAYAAQKAAEGVSLSASKAGKTSKFTLPWSQAKGPIRRLLSPKGKGATAAIALAVYAIAEGVDYVMDPANNEAVKVYPKNAGCIKATKIVLNGTSQQCQSLRQQAFDSSGRLGLVDGSNGIGSSFTLSVIDGKTYGSCSLYDFAKVIDFPDEVVCPSSANVETVSLEDLATRLLDAAAKGNTKAQDLVTSTVLDSAKAGEFDKFFDAAAVGEVIDGLTWTGASTGDVVGVETDSKADTEADTKPETDTKPKTDAQPFEMPNFCNWASWFCDGDTDSKDGNIEPEQPKIPTGSVNINFGGTCPASQSFPFTLAGRSFAFTMSFDSVCRIAESFGGLVKIISTIVAAYILTGIRS